MNGIVTQFQHHDSFILGGNGRAIYIVLSCNDLQVPSKTSRIIFFQLIHVNTGIGYEETSKNQLIASREHNSNCITK